MNFTNRIEMSNFTTIWILKLQEKLGLGCFIFVAKVNVLQYICFSDHLSLYPAFHFRGIRYTSEKKKTIQKILRGSL